MTISSESLRSPEDRATARKPRRSANRADHSARIFRGVWMALVLIFLYAPILVMIGLSFNASVSRSQWAGFTLKWYGELFRDPVILGALRTTLEVAVVATVVSTVIGTLGAIGMHAMNAGMANLLVNVSYLPMTTPDIVTGVSLMLMFLFAKVPLGKWTMIMAHIAFDIPYVLFSVMPKLRQLNPNLYEAALDLGCHPVKALYKVIIPEITPGIFTGALLAFTMSLDDFVISYFTSSDMYPNLSRIVYSSTKLGVKPTMYALSTLMFATILILLVIVNKRTKLENL